MPDKGRELIDCVDPYEYEGAGFIACLDSGMGGISVLTDIRRLLPQEDFIYFGDIANAPYGDKDTDQVQQIVLDQVNTLLTWKLKALILACNTATSVTVAQLRNLLDIPVFGLEPALKPAVKECMGRIVVLGTTLTLREKKFTNLLSKLSEARDIITLPCPGLMELIEEDPQQIAIGEYLQKILLPYKNNLDGIVLGCTHYLFLKQLLKRLLPNVLIFDGNEGIAKQCKSVMEQEGLLGSGTGQLLFLSSLENKDAEGHELFVDKCWKFYDFYEAMVD
ncbi:MAG: glutamate racemase [Bacillota bacterium]|jgi:glutamate racemase